MSNITEGALYKHVPIIFNFMPIERMPEDWRCLVTDGIVWHIATKVDGRVLLEHDITGWAKGFKPPHQEWTAATHFAFFPEYINPKPL